jgi:hypothetical protein
MMIFFCRITVIRIVSASGPCPSKHVAPSASLWYTTHLQRPPPPPPTSVLRACFTRVEFLFCRPLLLLLPFTPLAPFTGSSGCGGSEARCGGNGKQARQPGIFTHRLAFASHWHTCGVPALRPLPLQRGVLCVPVLLVGLLSYRPASTTCPLLAAFRAIYWQSSSHNRDTSLSTRFALSPLVAAPPLPPHSHHQHHQSLIFFPLLPYYQVASIFPVLSSY